MIEMAVKDIQKYYGANEVLHNVSFELQAGERAVLIGRNGTGKSTLFKIIAGLLEYDRGTLAIRKGAVVGYLDQIPDRYNTYLVEEVLNEAFYEIFTIRDEMRKLEKKMVLYVEGELERCMQQYGRLQIQFEHQGGYEIEEKRRRICTGLKFSEEFLYRPFESLSGGEKTTVLLGKILLQQPDILLLDEPTNHLDIEAMEWLEEYVKSYPGAVLMISHDRYFLDRTVQKVIELERGEAFVYYGNYSDYGAEKQEQLLQQMQNYQVQQKKIKAMEEAIKRFRQWGAQSDNPKMFKKAASMEKRIEKIDKLDKPLLDAPKMQLDFVQGNRSGKDVITVTEVCKEYGEKKLLQNANLHVRYKDCIGIFGKNGCGKSTLIRMILGVETPDIGQVKVGSSVKIGYLEQNIYFPDEEINLLEALQHTFTLSEEKARRILFRFLFYKEDVHKKLKNLSGGEKVRLKLCILMNQEVNLLIMDEPTNHLDIDSREMLEEALLEFDGTILMISHDRYFLNKIAKKITAFEAYKLVTYEGSYEYFREKREEKISAVSTMQYQPKPKSQTVSKPTSLAPKIDQEEKKGREIEKQIEEVEQRLVALDVEMEQYGSDYGKLQELYEKKDELQTRLDGLLEQWLS